MLEQLQPFERAVFLLREVFEYEFAEIAAMLGKSEAACRRSLSRAKEHLRAHRPRFPASHEMHRHLLDSYIQATETGDMNTLMSLLSEDVILWTDGGGKIKQAALRPIRGREAVARMSLKTKRFWRENYQIERAEVNGQLAIIMRADGEAWSCLSIEVEGGQIQTIRVITNPEKLSRI